MRFWTDPRRTPRPRCSPTAKWSPGRMRSRGPPMPDADALSPAAAGFADIVRLEGVQKYFGAVHALRNIDLRIGRNEIVGLIGDNGAGKSTLIKTMTGVLRPSAGRIFVRDKAID